MSAYFVEASTMKKKSFALYKPWVTVKNDMNNIFDRET
jgi:hypothetical protein